MDILINVFNQRMKTASNNCLVEGTQEFIRLVFVLSNDWDDLKTFAQFQQNGKAYNIYLDENNSAFLPPEIVAGNCDVILYGTGGTVIATTNYLTLKLEENKLLTDISSTHISESLYTQLVNTIDRLQNTIAGRVVTGEYVIINGIPQTAEEGAEVFNSGRAIGMQSHAENFGTAIGQNSHAENFGTAIGQNSHAENDGKTTQDGYGAHAENSGTANGYFSHAENSGTANGWWSHASGINTVAMDGQFVIGKNNKEVVGSADDYNQSSNITNFVIGCGTPDTPANAMRVTAAGECYGSSAFIGSGADFGEYFEWLDGNPNNEDRRGRIVTLDGDKIKLADENDIYILGIVSGSGCFIGNSQSENWQGMYLKDIFGEKLTKQIEIPEKIDEKTGKTIPAHTVMQFVVNPEYNNEQEYISRELRKEWSPIGFIGQIVVVDDGTCQANSYCKPSKDGIGTASSSGFRVMARLDDTHIKVLVK